MGVANVGSTMLERYFLACRPVSMGEFQITGDFFHKTLEMSLKLMECVANVGVANVGVANVGVANVGVAHVGVANVGVANVGSTMRDVGAGRSVTVLEDALVPPLPYILPLV